ncbi:hypothetical protein B0T10DRAFT_465413 [Thelonectria olida]|uniref:Uncharacterized protein n=1 Tax=Thelonectria olida TaxID=1576542 RepID=A0A9P8VU37_9HYPO|nr:hypothetical protein B0T10DRAFT_465413 [Thelonectria olida]
MFLADIRNAVELSAYALESVAHPKTNPNQTSRSLYRAAWHGRQQNAVTDAIHHTSQFTPHDHHRCGKVPRSRLRSLGQVGSGHRHYNTLRGFIQQSSSHRDNGWVSKWSPDPDRALASDGVLFHEMMCAALLPIPLRAIPVLDVWVNLVATMMHPNVEVLASVTMSAGATWRGGKEKKILMTASLLEKCRPPRENVVFHFLRDKLNGFPLNSPFIQSGTRNSRPLTMRYVCDWNPCFKKFDIMTKRRVDEFDHSRSDTLLAVTPFRHAGFHGLWRRWPCYVRAISNGSIVGRFVRLHLPSIT